jgi:hypothetical protein
MNRTAVAAAALCLCVAAPSRADRVVTLLPGGGAYAPMPDVVAPTGNATWGGVNCNASGAFSVGTGWGTLYSGSVPSVTANSGSVATSDRIGGVFQSIAGASAGLTGPFNMTAITYGPVVDAIIISSAAGATSTRFWFAMPSSTIETLPAVASGSSTVGFVGLAVDTSVSGDFQLCSGDGVSYSCTDTGTPYTANTTYLLRLDWSTPTQVIASAWSQPSTQKVDNFVAAFSLIKTTNIAVQVGANLLGITVTIRSLSGTTQGFGISSYFLRQRG